MDFQFIDNNAGIGRGARKLIRSQASRNHRVGKKRPSRLSQLCKPVRTILAEPQPTDVNYDPEADKADSSGPLSDFISSVRPPVGDFMTFPGQVSPRSIYHLRNFLYQITHSMMAEDLGGRIDTRIPANSMWVLNTFTNEAYFHSSVATCITIFEPEAARCGADPEILRHHSRSLQLVNERLSGRDALENSTLVAIIGLSQYERAQGRYEEALVHVQGLHRLALLRGGAVGLGNFPALAQKLFRADLEIAFYFGTQTTFRAEDLPGQNTAVWLRNLYKKDTQAYHRSKRMTLDLEPGLQASFLDLMSLSAFANGCSVCPTKLRAYTFHDLVILFGFRLVQIRPLQQPGFATRFETLLHLGLMAFLTTFLAGLSRKRPNFKSITDPLQWVIQAARGERDDFQKIVLWALLLGGDVLFTEADEDWFLPRVAEVTTVLKLEEWDDVEEIVTKFPWIRSIHGKTAMYLWQKSQGLISRTSD